MKIVSLLVFVSALWLESSRASYISDGQNEGGEARKESVSSTRNSGDGPLPRGLSRVSGTASLWPFDHKNKSQTDSSCGHHEDCFSCSNSSMFCHWCAHDQACHVIGSVYGCLEGADCANKSKTDTSCSSHRTCSECALSSSLCHWCAHDNQCHAVGSVYGCVSGVDCYSNDRCRREVPEPLNQYFFQEIGLIPLLIIFVVGFFCAGCATICFFAAGNVKGAYEDLADVAASDHRDGLPRQPPLSSPPSSSSQGRDPEAPTSSVISTTATTAATPSSSSEDDGGEALALGALEELNEADQQKETVVVDEHKEEDTPLLENQEEGEPVANFQLMEDQLQQQEQEPFLPSEASQPRFRACRSKHVQRLFNMCRACYLFNILTIFLLMVATLRYYPKITEYNICNDQFAWKSLVDSMTNLRADADFETLISVSNPNKIEVFLEMGTGTFEYNGATVGTFEIPPTRVAASSINDLTMVATFSPDKWDALSLTAEYYRGTLTLMVDANTVVRVPALLNYTFEADIHHMRVSLSDPALKDRHLCACPTWSDSKTKPPEVSL